MLSNKKQDWEILTVNVPLNIGESLVPMKILKNISEGISIAISPYRIIFEPCIPCDNYCRVDIEFANDIPNHLVELLNSYFKQMDKAWLEHTNKKMSCIFEVVERELSPFLTLIENFLIQTINKNKMSLENGLNLLREFLGLPQINRVLSRKNMFSQLDGSLSGGNPLTKLQASLLQGFLGLPQINRELSRNNMFSQLDGSLSGRNPLTELQTSLLKGFIGFRN